jgi:hypothetical protein
MKLDHGAILRKETGHTTAYNGFRVAIANAVVNCWKYGIASVLEGLADKGYFSSPRAPATYLESRSGFSTGNPASVQPRQPPSMEMTLV